MKTRRTANRQLRFEGLEGRMVLSAAPGLQEVAGLAVQNIAAAPAPAAADTSLAGVHVRESNSTNWSGYAVFPNAVQTKGKNAPPPPTFTDVQGSWTVPTVNTATDGYSSFWVGIDGYNSGTVEQIGIEADVIGGMAQYSAWYEMYPAYPVTIAMTITPGHVMSAEVAYKGSGNFVLSIADTTTNLQPFSTTQKSSSAKLSSAEWIAEAPWSGGVLPLANFGSVTFTGANATLNTGANGSISNSAWKNDAMTMVTVTGRGRNQTTTVIAKPTGLSDVGSTFTVNAYPPAAKSMLAAAAVNNPTHSAQPSSDKHDQVTDLLLASPDLLLL